MPVLSMFYGIIVRMQKENGGKHHVPHIHVICAEELAANWKLLCEGERFFQIDPLK